MANPLDTEYRRTEYRVRLRTGGFASVRVDQPLPDALAHLIGDQCWAIVTGWNPGAVRQSREMNRQAQRKLLALLKAAKPAGLQAAVGVGAGHWRECSLLAVGIDAWRILAIAEACGQLAIVCGNRSGPATLAWL